MMKNLHNWIFGVCGIISSATNAQPILTASGINSVIGESYTYFSGNYISPGAAGAGQTWDVSAMVAASSGLTSVVSPASTSSGALFPGSNLAADNPSYTEYSFNSSTLSQSLGMVMGTTLFQYSDPYDLLHFPFTYNSTYTDTWVGQFSLGSNYYRRGTVTITADGYGTLLTPNGTYTNVIRVHYVSDHQDSTFSGAPIVTYQHQETYIWFKEGIHAQLASVYIGSGAASYDGGNYLAGSVGVGMDETFGINSSAKLFPNPAIDQITVDFTLTENKSLTVQIYNAIGQKMDINQSVEGFQGVNTIQLDVATLPEGIYFAQILLEGNTAATKCFVVAK